MYNDIITYSGKKYNCIYDIHEINTNIFPNYLKLNKVPEIFKITKIKISCIKGKIHNIYINGNHPNVDFLSRRLNFRDFKNIKFNSKVVKNICEFFEKFHFDKKIYFELNPGSIDLCKINKNNFYFYSKENFNTEFDVYEYSNEIVPDYIIDSKNKKTKIKKIPNNFKIKNTRIFTKDNKIYSIRIDTMHPNADVLDGNFCLPNWVYGKDIELFDLIKDNVLKFYNIKNPHFHILNTIKPEVDK